MDYKKLLRDFMGKFGPSGYEKEIAYLLRDTLSGLADSVAVDRIGNVIATFAGSDPECPSAMIFAHLDQLGFIVRRIEPDGFIQVDRLGGVPEKVLPGLNLRILTKRGGYVDGVFGNKSHHAAGADEKYRVDPVTSLLVDIGAGSAGEARALGVDIGCPATYLPFSQELAGDFVSGTAVDDRGGLVALAVAAARLKGKRPRATVHLVGTVWEEFNLRGAMIAARSCRPDIAISLDVVLAGDTPDLGRRYEAACGKGPALVLYSFHGRGTLNGTLPHAGLIELAERAAAEEEIPLQRFAALGILTDNAYAQLEGMGMAAVELGFPARYTHTPVEVANVQDIVALGELAAAMAGRIGSDFPLNRY
ncbi:MAG: M20/M25/M40 family metallo-hydrolase [Planctomycetota bacterium]|jgi:putative aminopeptidase FrvX|nr:M20/M25/M40 family metallo-hydrolase [Planctomycetota bacterium]